MYTSVTLCHDSVPTSGVIIVIVSKIIDINVRMPRLLDVEFTYSYLVFVVRMRRRRN